jgi:hypothetical protein
MKISLVVFWVVRPCGPVGGYQRFGGTYRLHLQGELWNGVTTKKTKSDIAIDSIIASFNFIITMCFHMGFGDLCTKGYNLHLSLQKCSD